MVFVSYLHRDGAGYAIINKNYKLNKDTIKDDLRDMISKIDAKDITIINFKKIQD